MLEIKRSPSLSYIDSMRGLCALYVAACHAYLMYSPAVLQSAPDVMAPAFVLATSWLAFGRLAVAVFIVISGYCLMLPVVRSEHRRLSWTWTRFMSRRARRILPPYYGALAVSIALIVLVPDLDDPAIGEWHKSFPALTTGSVLSHLAVIHNYFPDWQYSINHPMWSIATEWQIYFLFPGLVWVWSRFGLRRLIIASLAICVVLQLLLALFWPGHNPWPPQFVALFGLGMAGAAYNHPRSNEDRRPHRQVAWGRHALWLFTLGVISTLLVGNARPQVPDLLVGVAAVSAMIALTQTAQRGLQPWTLRTLECAPLVSLGRFSYSLYLLHAPILALFFVIARQLGLGMTSIQFFILGVGLPVTVMASYVFYLVFERPFLSTRPSARVDRDVVLPGATTYVPSAPLQT